MKDPKFWNIPLKIAGAFKCHSEFTMFRYIPFSVMSNDLMSQTLTIPWIALAPLIRTLVRDILPQLISFSSLSALPSSFLLILLCRHWSRFMPLTWLVTADSQSAVAATGEVVDLVPPAADPVPVTHLFLLSSTDLLVVMAYRITHGLS